MRVLHYIDCDFIGWEFPYIELLKSLEALGVENFLICRPNGRLERITREHNLQVFTYKHLFSWSPILPPKFVKLIKGISPDIIHTRLSNAARISGIYGKKFNIPVVSTLDLYPKIKYYKNSTLLLACSKSVADYTEAMGFPKEKITVVPNPVNVKFYEKNERIRNEIRKTEGLKENDLCFLGMGRLVNWKGFDILLRSFAEFLKVSSSKGIYLWIAGDGDERENLERLAKELDINEHVKFWGLVEDVRKILWASDIYVHPSKGNEPFGLSLLQAMSAGLPVIASRSGGITDIINASQGLLFSKGNVEELTNCMKKSINEIEVLSKAGFERAKDFDSDIIAEKIYDIYKKLWRDKIESAALR